MLAVLIGSLVGFACGAILGIADCKKTYGIPKEAKPEFGGWYSSAYIDELERVYALRSDVGDDCLGSDICY